jgi:hypothetical protein
MEEKFWVNIGSAANEPTSERTSSLRFLFFFIIRLYLDDRVLHCILNNIRSNFFL